MHLKQLLTLYLMKNFPSIINSGRAFSKMHLDLKTLIAIMFFSIYVFDCFEIYAQKTPSKTPSKSVPVTSSPSTTKTTSTSKTTKTKTCTDPGPWLIVRSAVGGAGDVEANYVCGDASLPLTLKSIIDYSYNGGISPSTFTWSTGAGSQDITTSTPGTFTVEVQATNQGTPVCATASITIEGQKIKKESKCVI